MSAIGDLDLRRGQAVAARINRAGNGKGDFGVHMDVDQTGGGHAAAVAATVKAFGSINVGLFNAGA